VGVRSITVEKHELSKVEFEISWLEIYQEAA